jgi:hypothetical protein
MKWEKLFSGLCFSKCNLHRYASADMQFALTYMYWLMSAKRGRTVKEFLKEAGLALFTHTLIFAVKTRFI